MSNLPKELEALSLADLKKLVAEKEQTEKDVLLTEIKALEGELKKKHDALTALTGEAVAPVKKTRRGRNIGPIGSVSDIPATGTRKATRKGKAKRGALGEQITSFLAGKPKGAHVKEIAAAIGSKPANITAWIYATGKKLVKKVDKATFALKK